MSELSPFAVLVPFLSLWLLLYLREWRREDAREDRVRLYCPNREGNVPIAAAGVPEPVYTREGDQVRIYGYKCRECGRVHTWLYGPPAPIYVGDKITLTITGGGLDCPELVAD